MRVNSFYLAASLLAVKLWDLVIKKYMLELFQFLSYFTEKSQNFISNVLPIHFRTETDSVRVMYCILLSVAYVCAQCSSTLD